MSLTDLRIRKLKAPEKGQKTYFDEAQKGFGVRVSQGGTKTFIVLQGKARKRKTLGKYPDLSLAEARILAKRAQADLALEAPVLDKLPTMPFSEACERFLKDAETRTKIKTVSEYRRYLQSYFSYDKALAAVTKADIVGSVEAIRGKPSEQQHAFVAIRTMMNWCRRRGFVENSPVPPLTFKTTARSRVLSDDEVCAIWHRAEAMGYPYGRIIQLLILTGQRRGEIAGLRYSWIDGNEIVFPTGFAKNRREHAIPIGHMAMKLIENLPESSDLLFPSRLSEETCFNGWSKAKRAFDREINVADYTLHDIRRTFSSTMALLGTPIHVTERLLNHVSGTISGVAAIYNRHSYKGEMRDAIDAYEQHLATILQQ